MPFMSMEGWQGHARDGRIQWLIKPTHVIPAFIQCCLFAYWALYWRELPDRLPGLLRLLVFGYAFDAALQLAVTRRYVASFAPVPIVGSTGLFVMYEAHRWWIAGIAVAVAMLSKALLRADGRHIFNPSAFGLTVLGLCTLVVPSLSGGEIAHEFSAPPNMTELLVLFALIAQLRVPVVLMTIAAWAGMEAQNHWLTIMPHIGMGGGPFVPLWPPVALILVLLITDPATSPRRPEAQLIYGGMLGIATGLCGEVLMIAGASDYYGKVLAVPLANGLSPVFDHWARKIGPIAWLQRPFNRVHVLAWVVLVGVMLPIADKGSFFGGDLHVHERNRTPGVVARADGTISCDDNPMQCRAFAFDEELRCWWRAREQGRECGNLHRVRIDPAVLKRVGAGGTGEFGRGSPGFNRRP